MRRRRTRKSRRPSEDERATWLECGGAIWLVHVPAAKRRMKTGAGVGCA